MRTNSIKKWRNRKKEKSKQPNKYYHAFLIQRVRNPELSTEEQNAVQQLMSSALRRAMPAWVGLLHSRWLIVHWAAMQLWVGSASPIHCTLSSSVFQSASQKGKNELLQNNIAPPDNRQQYDCNDGSINIGLTTSRRTGSGAFMVRSALQYRCAMSGSPCIRFRFQTWSTNEWLAYSAGWTPCALMLQRLMRGDLWNSEVQS